MEHFSPVTAGELCGTKAGDMVKFYGKYIGLPQPTSSVILVTNDVTSVMVDVLSFDSCILEKGEWYRFLVEIVHPTIVMDNLEVTFCRGIIPPVLVDGFNSDEYGKTLRYFRNFSNNIDDLVSYAYKHR